MAFDGLFVHYLLKEITSQVQGQQIRKIVHPYKGIIEFILQYGCLSIGFNTEFPHILYTKKKLNYGEHADSLCMALRKNLTNGKLISIKQLSCDRVIEIIISKYNKEEEKYLNNKCIISFAGRNSNFYFYYGKNNYFSLKKMPFNLNTDKIDPLKNEIVFLDDIKKKDYNNIREQYSGISKETFDILNNYNTIDISPSANLKKFSLFPIYDKKFSNCLETIIYSRNIWLLEKRKEKIFSVIKKEIRKIKRKIDVCTYELNKCKDHEQLKQKADILASFRNKIKKGDTSVNCFDFYNNNEIIIEIDPRKTANKNIDKLYNKARKAKRGLEKCNENVKNANLYLNYLKETELFIENAENIEELIPIEVEFIKDIKITKKREFEKVSKTSLNKIYIDDDSYVIAGRSSKENDKLTFNISTKKDMWFHAKDVSGSHVILKTAKSEITNELIKKAAAVAAYYSKNRKSDRCDVIYTKRANVRKPKGAPPGAVLCPIFKTISVKPSIDFSN